MAINEGTFETLIPSRYISFTLPLHSLSFPTDVTDYFFHSKQLQISVLDSPIQPSNNPPKVAAMLVPKNLEKDWIFTTEAGHLQLLLSSPRNISRLILIGNSPNNVNDGGDVGKVCRRIVDDPICREKLETCLYPLVMALLPREMKYVEKGNLEVQVPFLSYEDNVKCSVVLERCVGTCVGEMLVEDVEIEGGSEREFRRRLRFKRMPNLVQTEIRIVPVEKVDCGGGGGSGSVCVGESEFEPDLGVLVHPYLAPMVAGVSLISGYIQERLESSVRPKAFCIGVGGGALLSFLGDQLDFEVVGVEMDEVVLRVAKEYFGLKIGKSIQVSVGDGIEILEKMACHGKESKVSPTVAINIENECHLSNLRCIYDVIMVDLDSSDSKVGISAPALEFVQNHVLRSAKSCLFDHGILVLNVIPPNREFYNALIHELKEVFEELHEIDCGNQENFVLIASRSIVVSDSGACENKFLRRLKFVMPEIFINSVKNI